MYCMVQMFLKKYDWTDFVSFLREKTADFSSIVQRQLKLLRTTEQSIAKKSGDLRVTCIASVVRYVVTTSHTKVVLPPTIYLWCICLWKIPVPKF